MAENTALRDFTLPEKYQSYVDKDTYQRFLTEQCRARGIRYAIFSFPVLWSDLLEKLTSMGGQNKFLFYWEKPCDNFAIAAGGTLVYISSEGQNRFEDTYRQIQSTKRKVVHFNACQTQKAGAHFLGGFSFFNEISDKNWDGFEASSFVLPKHLILKKGDTSSLSIAFSLDQHQTPAAIHEKVLNELSSIDQTNQLQQTEPAHNTNGKNLAKRQPPSTQKQYNDWVKSVEKAKQRIADNGLEKVVLARQLKLSKQKQLRPVQILGKLRSHYPKCSSFLFRMRNSAAFIGCSPEQLLSFDGETLRTEALAGSIARGSDPKKDTAFEKELLTSTKNNLEHHYVVQSIESDLAPLACDVQRQQRPVIKKLANVQHLYTPVKAKIKNDTNSLTILGRLHPTPAVGGYPRKKAVEYIQKNESFNRGWFASPVGWINANDFGEFTVAIRSGLIDESSALLFAGCGIVADSDPKAEWQETNLKFMPMLSALNYD